MHDNLTKRFLTLAKKEASELNKLMVKSRLVFETIEELTEYTDEDVKTLNAFCLSLREVCPYFFPSRPHRRNTSDVGVKTNSMVKYEWRSLFRSHRDSRGKFFQRIIFHEPEFDFDTFENTYAVSILDQAHGVKEKVYANSFVSACEQALTKAVEAFNLKPLGGRA